MKPKFVMAMIVSLIKVQEILKGRRDSIPSPSRSHEHFNFVFLFFSAKHCWALSTNFLKSLLTTPSNAHSFDIYYTVKSRVLNYCISLGEKVCMLKYFENYI